MSRLGSAIRSRAIALSTASIASPRTMRETSLEVPPMSNGIRFGAVASSATRRAPARPPAGPESTVPAATRIVSSIGATPPWDCMMRIGPSYPAAARRCSRPAR